MQQEPKSLLYRRMVAAVRDPIGCFPGMPMTDREAYVGLKLFISMGLSTRIGALTIMMSLLAQTNWAKDYTLEFFDSAEFGATFDDFFADTFGDGCEYEWAREDDYYPQAELKSHRKQIQDQLDRHR